MDWHMIWAIASATQSEIVILLVVLATVATYFVYNTYETGVYCTIFVFAGMIFSGIMGHVFLAYNGIFFSHDIGRSAVIGATLAMTACFIVAVLTIRLVSDTVYSRYRAKKAPAPTATIPLNRPGL